jgi:hypothetical protein
MQLPETTIASQSLLKTGFRNASQVEVLLEVFFMGGDLVKRYFRGRRFMFRVLRAEPPRPNSEFF